MKMKRNYIIQLIMAMVVLVTGIVVLFSFLKVKGGTVLKDGKKDIPPYHMTRLDLKPSISTKVPDISIPFELLAEPETEPETEPPEPEPIYDEATDTWNWDDVDYSKYYETDNPLTAWKGALYYGDHKETYYSQNVLPGGGLNIPGRHVCSFDGTVRDEEGYICVAADPSFYPWGSIVETSLGYGKVYDCGCAYGTIDIYCDW